MCRAYIYLVFLPLAASCKVSTPWEPLEARVWAHVALNYRQNDVKLSSAGPYALWFFVVFTLKKGLRAGVICR